MKLFTVKPTGDPFSKTGWDVLEFEKSFDERYPIFRGDISPMQGRDNTIRYLRKHYPGCKVRVER